MNESACILKTVTLNRNKIAERDLVWILRVQSVLWGLRCNEISPLQLNINDIKDPSFKSLFSRFLFQWTLSFAGSEVWKEVRFYSVVCLLFLFSVSIVIWKLALYRFKQEVRGKQRVHVTELTHQGREFCLKRAINYIRKGLGHRAVF